MDYEKIFKALLKEIVEGGDYKSWTRAEISLLLLKCMTSPEEILKEERGKTPGVAA